MKDINTKTIAVVLGNERWVFLMKPLISIIVPVYKVEQYLNRCVDSIINQTYKNLEIILVDDGSPDNCGKICDEYATKDSRIKVIHKENGGLSSARNAGLDIASGGYIGFVDSDDWIESNMYYVLINLAIENDSDIVQCGYWSVSEKGDKIRKFTYKNNKFTSNEDVKHAYFISYQLDVVAWNKLYRRDIFQSLRYMNGKRNEDTFIMPEIVLITKKLFNTEQWFYHYVQRAGSIMKTDFEEKNFDALYSKQYTLDLCIQRAPDFEEAARIGICLTCIYLYENLKKSNNRKNRIFEKRILNTFGEQYDYIKKSNTLKTARMKTKVLIHGFSISRTITVLLYKLYRKIKG
jgi:Glycosyltransferases involved in cell wall biogenesis